MYILTNLKCQVKNEKSKKRKKKEIGQEKNRYCSNISISNLTKMFF